MGVIENFSTTQSNRYMKEIFGQVVFKYSKPHQLIQLLLKVTTNMKDIILDFFAGSATTAHAVMRLNAEDGGDRKFIMVQLPEKINARKSREAYAFCRNKLRRPATIAEIAKERIRRAGKQINEQQNGAAVDTGFRAFTVQGSLLADNRQQPLTQTEKSGLLNYRTSLKSKDFEPLLYEALLKSGVTLDLPLAVRKAGRYPFAICDRRCYCVTEGLTQAIVRQIAEQHGDAFDILYYLSDCPAARTSYTKLEAAVRLVPGDKQIKALNFY